MFAGGLANVICLSVNREFLWNTFVVSWLARLH